MSMMHDQTHIKLRNITAADSVSFTDSLIQTVIILLAICTFESCVV